MRKSRALVLITFSMVLTAAFASPALAEFGPRVPVVTNGCTSTGGASDSVAQGADVVGFASFNCDDAIWMFTQHAGKWTSERTDVHGVVLGVARSSAGVWLLFSNTNGVYVARRTTNGWFGAGPRLLEPGKGVLGGSVIASGDNWWAVWATDAGPLHQARSLNGGNRTVEAITHVRAPTFDEHPRLGLLPGGHAVLVWQRAAIATSSNTVRLATADAVGHWRSRQLAAAGTTPELATVGATAHVAWVNRGTVSYANNRAGLTQVRRTFTTNDPARFNIGSPVITATPTRVAIAFQAERRLDNGQPSRLSPYVLQVTLGGPWTGGYAAVNTPAEGDEWVMDVLIPGDQRTLVMSRVPREPVKYPD